jgi:membrane protein required for colicin V production
VNWIDLTLLVVLLLFGLRGYFRGLFREAFSLIGLAAGLVGASRYSEPLAILVATHWNAAPMIVKAVVFLICFFLIYFLFNVVGWLLHRSAKVLFLQTVNRLGGVVVGVGKGAALEALVVFALTSTTLVPPAARAKLDNAYLVSPLARLADGLIRFGKAKIFINDPGEARALMALRAA